MQNNVTYLSRKLQRSLDNNYNVTDMPAVIEIISTLEKTPVTKELLETTRLGKYINELRRKTSNESLAKRAKELLKKWRDLILPDANGQIRSASANSDKNAEDTPKNHSKKRGASATPPDGSHPSVSAKKILLNGQNREYDFSDNSNCSVKDLKKTDVIFINSDSNSSMPESLNPGDPFEAAPKKRGRKKGSKNHKNLVIAAEESFTNKMAVSRNSKVKTTQELLADIQNRKPSTQDIELRTAQLTESLSRIEHKLNPQKTPKGAQKSAPIEVNINEIISDDEIVDVVGTDAPPHHQEIPEPLTIENLRRRLPPIDPACLEERDDAPGCVCPTPKVSEMPRAELERITVQITDTKESLFAPPSPPSPPAAATPPVVFLKDERTSDDDDDDDPEKDCENLLCPAKLYLVDKYRLEGPPIVPPHDEPHPNVNGNYGAPPPAPPISPPPAIVESIVPHFMSERLTKIPNENFQKYSISIEGEGGAQEDGGAEPPLISDSDNVQTSDFREWHETLDVISYNEELLRILPYVIID